MARFINTFFSTSKGQPFVNYIKNSLFKANIVDRKWNKNLLYLYYSVEWFRSGSSCVRSTCCYSVHQRAVVIRLHIFFYFLFRPKSFAFPTLFRFVFDLWFQKFITKWVSWWSKRFDFICVQRHNVPVPRMDITKLNRQMSIIRHTMPVEYVEYNVVQQRDAQFWIYSTIPSNHQSGKTTQTSIYACIRTLSFISCVAHTYFLLSIETERKRK